MAIKSDSFEKNKKSIYSLSVDYFRDFFRYAVCNFLFVMYRMVLKKTNVLNSGFPPSYYFSPI